MKENKTEYLKARCTAGEKKKISELADEMVNDILHNEDAINEISESIKNDVDNEDVVSYVENEPELPVADEPETTEPDNTKQKIQKELEKI